MTELNLLVIDDEIDIAEFAAELGSQLGFTSTYTSTSKDFMDNYQTQQPCAVVLDVCIPEMDANEIITWMSQQKHASPVILMSGSSTSYMSTARQLAHGKGIIVTDMLKKPITADAMKTALAKVKKAYTD